MSSVIETLASKKKPPEAPATMILPVVQTEHEGACGENCGCGANESEGGCCGG
ncbi:MAG TPA: hypothetical protein VEY12_07015 [Thermoplasmata archaeon]|nr:hypothetical protein [Thermoplasmata archaeon]